MLYKKAAAEDVLPALTLALRVLTEEKPAFAPGAAERFKTDCTENERYVSSLTTGKNLMLVALDEGKTVGLISECGNGRISQLYIDGAYRRRGIATALMKHMVCMLKLRGFDTLILNAPSAALPFFLHFGFTPTAEKQEKNGFVYTLMTYKPNEIWDVYDINHNKTGRYAERGRKLEPGDYHLIVHIWKHNGRGEWLIDRRAMKRGTSIDGKWETTGGAAVAGDDSLSAALRETKEELGIELDPKKGVLIHSDLAKGYAEHTGFLDAWVFEHDCPIEDIRFQESETCDAMWATAEKIRDMMEKGEFLSPWFYPYFDQMVEKWGAET
ncbi:MAG: GNAT family N-acetyltransferase [Clostridiales bacterium]|nr:GNAT family N-acetyltransferase [Clostridiales bacterium]